MQPVICNGRFHTSFHQTERIQIKVSQEGETNKLILPCAGEGGGYRRSGGWMGGVILPRSGAGAGRLRGAAEGWSRVVCADWFPSVNNKWSQGKMHSRKGWVECHYMR